MSAPRAKSRDYQVGYGQPPAEHRFQKGTSGNPRGRPKRDTRALPGLGLREALLKAASQPLAMTLDGQRITTTRGEALVHQLLAQALKGDLRATKLYLDAVRALAPEGTKERNLTHEEALAELAAGPPDSIEIRFVTPDPARGEIEPDE